MMFAKHVGEVERGGRKATVSMPAGYSAGRPNFKVLIPLDEHPRHGQRDVEAHISPNGQHKISVKLDALYNVTDPGANDGELGHLEESEERYAISLVDTKEILLAAVLECLNQEDVKRLQNGRKFDTAVISIVKRLKLQLDGRAEEAAKRAWTIMPELKGEVPVTHYFLIGERGTEETNGTLIWWQDREDVNPLAGFHNVVLNGGGHLTLKRDTLALQWYDHRSGYPPFELVHDAALALLRQATVLGQLHTLVVEGMEKIEMEIPVLPEHRAYS